MDKNTLPEDAIPIKFIDLEIDKYNKLFEYDLYENGTSGRTNQCYRDALIQLKREYKKYRSNK